MAHGSGLTSTHDKPAEYSKAFYSQSGHALLVEQSESEAKIICISRSLGRIALFQTQRSHSILEPDEAVSVIHETRNSEILAIAEMPVEALLSRSAAELYNYLPQGDYRLRLPIEYLGCVLGRLSLQSLSPLASHVQLPQSRLLILTGADLLELE